MSTFKMPERRIGDGPISVSRLEGDDIAVEVETMGKRHSLVMSEYNAARIFGCLALMLNIPLSKTLGKAIKLGDGPVPMKFGRGDRSKMSLGERVAANLADQATIEALRAAGYEVDPVPQSSGDTKERG